MRLGQYVTKKSIKESPPKNKATPSCFLDVLRERSALEMARVWIYVRQ